MGKTQWELLAIAALGEYLSEDREVVPGQQGINLGGGSNNTGNTSPSLSPWRPRLSNL
jgi:hypothetical protein